jgi:hypothetical protein
MCSGSRYFRQLQEISDSVKEAERGDVDAGLALQRNGVVQAELERRINTARARQRYVRLIPSPLCARSSRQRIYSSLICPKNEMQQMTRRRGVVFCVNASSSVDTSHNGEVRSLRCAPVHRC